MYIISMGSYYPPFDQSDCDMTSGVISLLGVLYPQSAWQQCKKRG